jgi:putative drug exporter of the RND superfamily
LKKPFHLLGNFTYKYRFFIVLFWVVAVTTLMMFSMKLPDRLHGSGFEMDGEFQEVSDTLIEKFDYPASTAIILFEGKSVSPTDEMFKEHVISTIEEMKKHEAINEVVSPYDATGMIKDNRAIALVLFDDVASDVVDEVEYIKNHISSTSSIDTMVTGSPVIMEDMNKASQEDLFQAEMIGVPAALLVLVFAFGGLVAAILPLLIGIISVSITMAITYFIGGEVNLSVFVLNTVPMIGLALGIDFALLLVNRFREELQERDVKSAIVKSVETAGKAIAFSGLCVFVGLSGMLFINISIFKSIGIGAMVVVFVSVICALTFLPAILAILGKRVNKLTVLKISNNANNSRWKKFAGFVMNRPVAVLTITTIVLFISVIPALQSNLIVPEEDSLPEAFPSRVALEKYKESFGNESNPSVFMVLQAEDEILTNEAQLKKLEQLVIELKNDKQVSKVESLFEITKMSATDLVYMGEDKAFTKNVSSIVNGNLTVVKVFLHVESSSKEAADWIHSWKERTSEYNLLFGGESKFYEEIYTEIYNKAPLGLLVVLISTYFLLLIAFKSVILPLKAIIMNVLSLTATFGLLVILFQGEYFYNGEGIYLIIPVFIFCLVFGLSMDYEVFLISRIQEYYEETKDNTYATLMGLTATSKIITSAALIMIVITGAFAFTDIMPVKQMGLGIAIAIFLDATIVRMLLVPSLMKLMGKWNWWMPTFGRKKKKLTPVGNSESSL